MKSAQRRPRFRRYTQRSIGGNIRANTQEIGFTQANRLITLCPTFGFISDKNIVLSFEFP
ncbi:MAG: hypothetical protein KJ063_07575 [Anaerolineae bacterium]|nr:hypothetical protein [Anaerolineae bacterium]